MLKKSYLGIAICALSGCIGDNYTWLSASETIIYENHQGVAYQALLAGNDSDEVVFSIDGVDAHLFTMNQQTGEVQFVLPPDYETPKDNSLDNSYLLTVSARNKFSGEKLSKLDISIIVENLKRIPRDLLFPLPNSYVVPNANDVVPLVTAGFNLHIDQWRPISSNIVNLFKDDGFGVAEIDFDPDALSNFWGLSQFNDSGDVLKKYLEEKYIKNYRYPTYAFATNPRSKITISYAHHNSDGYELEWSVQDELSGPKTTHFLFEPKHIFKSRDLLYIADETSIWTMSHEGENAEKIYENKAGLIEKILVNNANALVLINDKSMGSWRLVEVQEDGMVTDRYQTSDLTDKMLGINYDVDIIDMSPEFPVVFLPEYICDENIEKVIKPLVYILDDMGLSTNSTLLIDYEKLGFSNPLFECRKGLLVNEILADSAFFSVLGFANNIIDEESNNIILWGRKYSERDFNDLSFPSILDQGRRGFASHFFSGDLVDQIKDFGYIKHDIDSRGTPDARQFFYIKDDELYMVNNTFEEQSAARLSHPDYKVNSYTAEKYSSLIYSIGVWGDERIPVLGVHHILSGASSYIALELGAE